MDLEVTSRQSGSYVVLAIKGEVDVYTAPQLREAILEQTSSGQFNLALDCKELEFLDSTGLGVLVGALKRVRENAGSLVLANVPPRIRKVFDVTALTKVFSFAPTVEELV